MTASARHTRTRILLGRLRPAFADAPFAPAARDLGDLDVSRVLVIAPHPDDEVIGAGGLILRLARQEARVCVLFLTREGRRSIVHSRPVCGLPRRAVEARAAQAVLAYDRAESLEFEELSLPRADCSASLTAAIGRAIVAERPQLILAPGLDETHPDHRAAARATLLAAYAAWIAGELPGLRGVLLWEIWGACRGANAYLRIDADDAATLRAALACYVSQVNSVDYHALLALIRESRAGMLPPSPDGHPWAEAYRALWWPSDAGALVAGFARGANAS
jgi:LmbE family N-acetylglucosaminyl deacetylase